MPLNSAFVEKMKAHIANTHKKLDKKIIRDDHAKCEYLKYEIRKFSVKFSKLLSQNTKSETLLLKRNLELLECTANYMHSKWISCKIKLDQFYKEKANGIEEEGNVIGTNMVKNLQISS